jgi:hypothetical protein
VISIFSKNGIDKKDGIKEKLAVTNSKVVSIHRSFA